jgi:hypothetical protein
MAVYFQYLDALHSLAASSGTPFHFLDRILYIFDKESQWHALDATRREFPASGVESRCRRFARVDWDGAIMPACFQCPG